MLEKKTENSHDLLKDILTLAQVCGLFPLSNIRNPTPDELKFKWMSWKILYFIIIWLSTLFCGLVAVIKAFSYKSALNQLITCLFYLCASFVNIIFIDIAKKWGVFIQSLCKLEEELSIKYSNSINLKRRLRVMAILLYVPALGEHCLATINYIYSYTCKTNGSDWEQYFKKQFHHVYYFFPYSFASGVFILIISWVGLIIWNFGDVFIICISIIISTRFRQVSNALRLHLSVQITKFTSHSKYQRVIPAVDLIFFNQIRQDYNKLALITKKLNKLLSNLIITSYAFNLSIILVQLFNSIREMEAQTERTYFFYSFGFVITRTILVSIYAASIHEESRRFLPILNYTPSSHYCTEIQRLISQIHTDSSALTGNNFFRITRGVVLNVIVMTTITFFFHFATSSS